MDAKVTLTSPFGTWTLYADVKCHYRLSGTPLCHSPARALYPADWGADKKSGAAYAAPLCRDCLRANVIRWRGSS